jgi:hypothetical protein
MKSAAEVLEREFPMPFLAHACLVHSSGCRRPSRLVAFHQVPQSGAGHAARALGIDLSTVVVHNEYQGGDFGRRSGREHTTEAVPLAKAAGGQLRSFGYAKRT